MNIYSLRSSKLTALVAAVAFTLSFMWSGTALAAPTTPVITTPAQSTSTSPIILTGTADASSTIEVTGGMGTSTATTTASGDWSASVGLNTGTNTLSVISIDASSTMSVAAMVVISYATSSSTTTPPTSTSTSATSSPIFTLTGSSTVYIRTCDTATSTYVDPGFTVVDSTGSSTTVTATSSGAVNLNQDGTYVITYVATDIYGNTATTTRTVNVDLCTPNGGGNGGGGGSQAINLGNGIIFTQSSAQALIEAGVVTGPFTIQVLGATTFHFVSDLGLGSTGVEVVELQARLALINYFNGPITGYYGPKTRAAVMKLQRNNDLPQTGVLDAATRALLNS